MPGLVRVAFVADILGVAPKTARAHLARAGCTPIRRPRLTAKDRDGPWYISVEDAVRLVDWLLPRVVNAAARGRALKRLRIEARLMGVSGQGIRYRGEGGTGSEAPPPNPPLDLAPRKFPPQPPTAPRDRSSNGAPGNSSRNRRES